MFLFLLVTHICDTNTHKYTTHMRVQILQHGARDSGVQEWWGVADWFQVVSQDVEGLVLERQQLLAQVEQLRHDLEQQQHRVLASEKVMMMMIIMEIIIITIK
jgi:hypothetical protein